MPTLTLYRGTGLDPGHKNIIDPAKRNDFFARLMVAGDYSDIEIAGELVAEDPFEISVRLTSLKFSSNEYDYAVIDQPGHGYFIEFVREDAQYDIAIYRATHDRISDLMAFNFRAVTLEQSTAIGAGTGGIDIPPILSGQSTPESVFRGDKVWLAAVCHDSGTIVRSGEHTVAFFEATEDILFWGARMARLTSAVYKRPGETQDTTLTIDAVTACYVVPYELLKMTGENLVSATLYSDYPGVIGDGFPGFIFSAHIDTTSGMDPEAALTGVYTGSILATDPRYSFGIGNRSVFVKLPEIGTINYAVTAVVTPVGGVSVGLEVNGAFYDLTPSLKFSAIYTAEDAQTRAISAAGNLISGAVGAASAIASGGAAHIIASGTQIAGQTVATLASGRAYSFGGGGFPSSCYLYGGDSSAPILFSGVAIFRFNCQNSEARTNSAKLRGHSGYMYAGSLSLASKSPTAPGYFRGSGISVPHNEEAERMLRDGVTVWTSYGVGVLYD